MTSSNHLKLIILLLAIALALGIAACVSLSMALYDSFSKLHFQRIFPLGYVTADSLLMRGVSAMPSISIWGDSRSSAWSTNGLADKFAVHNFSHGGMTSSQLLAQFGVEPAMRTDFAIVQIGINDLHPLGALEPYKLQIVSRLRRNILLVRDALLDRSETVILTTIFPPSPVPYSRWLTWDAKTLAYIDEVNAMIREATDGKRVIVLDAHAVLARADAYLQDRYVDDDFFLHVNPDAYARLNEVLRQLLAFHQTGRS